jgi:hypothetical protein
MLDIKQGALAASSGADKADTAAFNNGEVNLFSIYGDSVVSG